MSLLIRIQTESSTIFIINSSYFFPYETEFFPFQNNPKNLDPSYKMDLPGRPLELFGKGKTCIIANFHRTDSVICNYSRERKTRLRNLGYTIKVHKCMSPTYRL